MSGRCKKCRQMPEQLTNPLGHLLLFNFLQGNFNSQLLHLCQAVVVWVSWPEQNKRSKVKRPKCLRRQSFEVPPSAWAWAAFTSSLAAFGTRSQNGWENEENVEDEFSRGGVRKFAELRWWLEQVPNWYWLMSLDLLHLSTMAENKAKSASTYLRSTSDCRTCRVSSWNPANIRVCITPVVTWALMLKWCHETTWKRHQQWLHWS